MFIVYDIFFIVMFPLYLAYLTWRRKWHRGFGERLGFLPEPILKRCRQGKIIWVHAVSVGEVMAVRALLSLLAKERPQAQVVLSVVTKSGYSLAKKEENAQLTVIYAPLDFSLIVRRMIRLLRPHIYIVVETEFWPNMFWWLHRYQVPVIVINGRVSDRAFRKYRAFRLLLQETLKKVAVFVMQSESQARRIIELGAPPERVKMLGNLKFDAPVKSSATISLAAFGLISSDQVWLAASTHQGEEAIVLDVFNRLRKEFPDLRLMLAPRHPERTTEIEGLIHQAQLSGFRLSRGARSLKPGEVLLIDTIGDLPSLYALATVIFLGKSLMVGGGHNLIEPAAWGKPVIVGPRMENFADVVEIFLKHQAVLQVAHQEELWSQLRTLLSAPQRLQILGELSRQTVFRYQGALQKTMELVLKHFDGSVSLCR